MRAATEVRPGGGDGGPVRPEAACGIVAWAQGGMGTGRSSPVPSPVREREHAEGRTGARRGGVGRSLMSETREKSCVYRG